MLVQQHVIIIALLFDMIAGQVINNAFRIISRQRDVLGYAFSDDGEIALVRGGDKSQDLKLTNPNGYALDLIDAEVNVNDDDNTPIYTVELPGPYYDKVSVTTFGSKLTLSSTLSCLNPLAKHPITQMGGLQTMGRLSLSVRLYDFSRLGVGIRQTFNEPKQEGSSTHIYGYSTALSQGFVLVGAPSIVTPMNARPQADMFKRFMVNGSVFVYQLDGNDDDDDTDPGTYAIFQTLKVNSDADYYHFGSAVAMSEQNRVFVANPNDEAQGEVYFFELNSNTGTFSQSQKLAGFDARNGSDTRCVRDSLTLTLLDEDTLFVGAPDSDSVYVFEYQDTRQQRGFTNLQTLLAPTADGVDVKGGGEKDDDNVEVGLEHIESSGFGAAMAAQHIYLAISSPMYDRDSGRVYLYGKTGRRASPFSMLQILATGPVGGHYVIDRSFQYLSMYTDSRNFLSIVTNVFSLASTSTLLFSQHVSSNAYDGPQPTMYPVGLAPTMYPTHYHVPTFPSSTSSSSDHGTNSNQVAFTSLTRFLVFAIIVTCLSAFGVALYYWYQKVIVTPTVQTPYGDLNDAHDDQMYSALDVSERGSSYAHHDDASSSSSSSSSTSHKSSRGDDSDFSEFEGDNTGRSQDGGTLATSGIELSTVPTKSRISSNDLAAFRALANESSNRVERVKVERR